MTALRPHHALVGLFLAVCGCGGSAPAPTELAVRTLAYGVTECREDARVSTASQKLVILQGGREVTVKEGHFGPLPPLGLCPAFGYSRFGDFAAISNPLQRLAVSPDASLVAFEVTDDHSILAPYFPQGFLPPEEEGMFVVRSEGGGLRRLGDASREPCARVAVDPKSPTGLNANAQCWRLFFSPDGRTIAFTDLGPDDTGEDATQVFTIDLATGTRRQVTHLGPQTSPSPVAFTVILRGWLKDGTKLAFATNSTANGWQEYTVKADGTEDPVLTPQLTPVVLPGAQLVPDFRITEAATRVYVFALAGTAVNDIPLKPPIPLDIFVGHGEAVLQVTAFGRSDTGAGGNMLDLDEQRVLFTASADPFGANPYENCQLFSIDTLGGGLRQLTQWGEGQHSIVGCSVYLRSGCKIDGFERERRAGPDTALFYSPCDPLGTNRDGGQVFAVRSDGTGLRQLTHTRGVVAEANGTVSVELPGTWAYPPTWD